MVNLITENIDIWTTAQIQKNGTGRGNGFNNRSLHGIKKLRELILELAVRGKLVPQDPNDEPASVLLEKIAKEKIKLVKESKIQKEKPLPEISEDEKPFNVPDIWAWVRFIDILDFTGGSQPPKSNFSNVALDGYVQLIQIRDLGSNPQNIYVPRESVSKFCTAKDIMVGRYGASVGKVFWGKDGAYNVALIKLIDEFSVYQKTFLFNLMQSPLIQSYFLSITRSAQDGFSKNDIAPRLLPVPPRGEQHRIVAKVYELMDLCDKLEQQQTDNDMTQQTLVETLLSTLTTASNSDEFSEAWRRIANLFDILFTTEQSIDQLKQTILQLAVMGKLVPQDPIDEPASVLLEKIAKEKVQLIQEGKIKKEKALPKINDNEKPFELPARWEWSRIGEASLYTEYGMSEKTFQNIEGIPVLTMGDIQNGKVILGGQKLVSTSVEGLPNLYLKKGDLLYNRTNSAELVGKTGVFTGPDNAYTFASYLVRIRCMENCVHSVFLNLAMNTPLFRMTQIEPYLKQQCGQANVNATIMKSMIVPIPPINEQRRIIAEVDKLMALCDVLKARLKEAQITQIQLADAIVDKVTV